MLQGDPLKGAFQTRLGGQEPEVRGVRAGDDGQPEGLGADHEGGPAGEHRMHAERHAADGQGADGQPDQPQSAEDEEDEPGVDHEPAGAEGEQEAQVTPAVTPRAQVRCPGPAVRTEGCRHLDDPQPCQRCPDDHLAGELHAIRTRAESEDSLPPERPHPAVEVADGDAEEQSPDPREHGVAQVTVQCGHRSGRDPALEPVAHDEVSARAQGLHEGADIVQGIAVVGVGHEDELPAGFLDPTAQGGPVAEFRDGDHPGAFVAGDLLRTVGRTVVGNDDLAPDAEAAHRISGLADTHGERLSLVEAREHDGQLADLGSLPPRGGLDARNLRGIHHRRLVARAGHWLFEGSKLSGNLSGFRAVVVGDRAYRIVFRVQDDGRVCVVSVIGPRCDEEVYALALARLQTSKSPLVSELQGVLDLVSNKQTTQVSPL